MPFSLRANGLAMDDLEEKVCRCIPLTAGRLDNPSSSLLSPVNSADSDREAREVRLEEPEEAWLGGRLPMSRLIQCSHREELVEPPTELLADQEGIVALL